MQLRMSDKKLWIGTAISLFFLYLLFRKMDFGQLVAAFRDVDLRYLVAAVLANVASFYFRALPGRFPLFPLIWSCVRLDFTADFRLDVHFGHAGLRRDGTRDPGYIGTYHYACVTALNVFRIPQGQALSVALVIHAVSFLPVIVAGFVCLWGAGLTLKEFGNEEQSWHQEDRCCVHKNPCS